MDSYLFTGRLMHSRRTPVQNSFTYPVYQLLLNLDELPELDRQLWFFGYNRPNLMAIYDRDHWDQPERSIKENFLAYLARHGVEAPTGPIYMLTNPRVLGYVFNPVSFFYCYNEQKKLAFVVAEVNNTYDERYPYLLTADCALPALPRDAEREVKRYGAKKRLYVSPLMAMDAQYEFAFSSPLVHPNMFVQIDELQEAQMFFRARLWGKREPLTNRTLSYALLRYPFMTLQVITFIHWQAIKVYLKGVSFFDKPATPPAY